MRNPVFQPMGYFFVIEGKQRCCHSGYQTIDFEEWRTEDTEAACYIVSSELSGVRHEGQVQAGLVVIVSDRYPQGYPFSTEVELRTPVY